MNGAGNAEGGHPLANTDHFGEGFHTAFRKGLDNPLSTHLHQLIRIAPEGVYGRFCGHACAAIAEEGAFDAAILREACLSWYPRQAYGETSSERPFAELLASGLRLVPDEDWRAIAGFLDYSGVSYDAQAATTRERAAHVALAAEVPVRELVPFVSLVSFRDHDAEKAVGAIEVRSTFSDPDANGRRRQVITGWYPAIHGLPPIETADRNGFPSFDAAYAAAIEHAAGLHAAREEYRISRLRGSRDPAWAERHGPLMERVCRHLASTHEPGSTVGHRLRRYLLGPDYALAAFREARGLDTTTPAKRGAIDGQPLAFRLEWLLRDYARDWTADGPDGFLVRLALYGEAGALRRATRPKGDPGFGWYSGPWRSPEDLLAAWNAPEGLTPGPHPVPAETPAVAPAP